MTSGGRVLCVTALGHTVAEAQKRAYALMTDIPLGRLLLPERYRLARYRTRAELTRQFCQ